MPHHKKPGQQAPKKRARTLYIIAAIIIAILGIATVITITQPTQPSSTSTANSLVSSLTVISSQPSSISTTATSTSQTGLTSAWISPADFNLSGRVYESGTVLILEVNITNRFNAPVTYSNASIRLVAVEFSNGTAFAWDCRANTTVERHVSVNRLRFPCPLGNLPPNVRVVSAKYEITTMVLEIESLLKWDITEAVPSTFGQ